MFQIMVVEDDAELRELFCTVFSDNGYTPIPAGDGLEAFDILERAQVDLIVCDVMMPRMDGFEMIRALRETGHTVPVLIITAKEDLADKREGFRAGTDDYMVKPIDVHEMVWRVEALLRRSQLSAIGVRPSARRSWIAIPCRCVRGAVRRSCRRRSFICFSS